jgi:hypothetical protein
MAAKHPFSSPPVKVVADAKNFPRHANLLRKQVNTVGLAPMRDRTSQTKTVSPKAVARLSE